MNKEKKKYASIPFWSWNDKLQPDRLVNQIRWMKKNGMGGFFMHARSGLQTEYMSEEWMECIRVCAEEASLHDMKAWIYDENGWPSGFVGGKLLENVENRDRYILSTTGQFDENATVSYLLQDDKLLRVKDGEREGEYLNLYIQISAATVDILNPKVVEQFLELTHEQYRRYFGEAFSDKIEGFFTDEPQYHRWHTPYTEMVADYFRKEYNEDILDKLGLLFAEKEGFRSFRYRYWKTMQKLMLESWAKQVYNWCENHDVKLTGHYVEETTLGYQMMACGGVMPFYEYEHIPGIDWLGKASVGEISPRQVGSVAAQLGKKQVITETFGCCGWDVTPAELKRVLGFQYVNGVNMMCQHLIPYSERGVRKYDYPAHYSAVNPWVDKEFKTFNDYFTKLGYLLGEGEQHVNVAVFHPIRSAYFTFKSEKERDGFGTTELDAKLNEACRKLSERGIEYHFLDETLLEKYGFVKENQIGCGSCAYEYLVLPMMYTMDVSTERLLHQYVKQGGKILLLGNKPTYVEAEPYTYDYLETNCTIEEIEKAQSYRLSDYTTEIYTTYRTLDDKAFLYVINASTDKSYTQSFDCGKKIRSFKRIDLTDDSESQVSLTIKLEPGEDALLYLSQTEVEEDAELMAYEFDTKDAEVSFDENYLIVDYVRYSNDGKKYSKGWPCIALFHKLVKERYRGSIYLKYEFEVQEIPGDIVLRMEENEHKAVCVNGVYLTDKRQGKEWYIVEYDISNVVRQGINECVIEMDWYENESIHYALYGENVTESLRNCLAYDSELQPIELAGKFGVYPKDGYRSGKDERYVSADNFYIGTEPKCVTDITVDGFPFFSGEIELTKKIVLGNRNMKLRVPGEYQMAVVSVNEEIVGKLFFSKELDISKVAKHGENTLRIRFFISNRNRLGPHHTYAYEEYGVGPWHFGMYNEWEEEQCKDYRPQYDLKQFYAGGEKSEINK